jgi:Ran GTPase-activating protein (RanGAP) involved in mRNA processing and transport
MPNLKGINLASNLITATGFALLVNSLSQSLETLNMSFNSLGAGAICSISKAISRFPNLVCINLDNCDIGDIANDGMFSTELDEDNLSSKQLKICLGKKNAI